MPISIPLVDVSQDRAAPLLNLLEKKIEKVNNKDTIISFPYLCFFIVFPYSFSTIFGGKYLPILNIRNLIDTATIPYQLW